MKVIVFHQPWPMGGYKINAKIGSWFSSQGHETYLLQQLNGQPYSEEYLKQIQDIDPDLVFFEMLDKETFKVVEQLTCEKVLIHASNGILPTYNEIIDHHGKWFTKVMTNSYKMHKLFQENNITSEFFKYYFSVLDESDLGFVPNYNHDCVFLGMGFHRLHDETYRTDREIYFDDMPNIDYKIYGNGWPHMSHYGGVLPAEDIGKLYSSAKSGFALIGEQQRIHGQINNRYTEMAFSGLPIITQNYKTIDWYGSDKYLNFVSDKSEAYDAVLDIINNPDKYKENSSMFKQFIIEHSKEFFEKFDSLIKR
tara:strand:- start:230 stop:1156 length:927 start_codon:yes stop_codon:yes gene_type:complete